MMVGAGGFQLGTGGESAFALWVTNVEVKSANRKTEKSLFTVSPFLEGAIPLSAGE